MGEVKRTSSIETYLHTLYKYTNYSIRVLAYTGAGDGVLSQPIYCMTEEDGKLYQYIYIYFNDNILHEIDMFCDQQFQDLQQASKL